MEFDEKKIFELCLRVAKKASGNSKYINGRPIPAVQSEISKITSRFQKLEAKIASLESENKKLTKSENTTLPELINDNKTMKQGLNAICSIIDNTKYTRANKIQKIENLLKVHFGVEL